MKHFLKYAFKNIWTTLLGTVAGLPTLAHGVALKDPAQIITGAATVLIGLAAKDAHQ